MRRELFLEEHCALGHSPEARGCANLLSPSPEAEKVRRWLTKHARPSIRETFSRVLPTKHARRFKVELLSVGQVEDWEAELWCLSLAICDFCPLGKWEKASAEARRGHGRRVAKLARALAEELTNDIRPDYPSVLECFDEERALDMIRWLPRDIAKIILLGTGYTLDQTDYARTGPRAWSGLGQSEWRSPAQELRHAFPMSQPQSFPSLLRRLADYAEARISDPQRDKRPSVPHADIRAFARHLATYFDTYFQKKPNEVIAACVQLYFPHLSITQETIREWRGVK